MRILVVSDSHGDLDSLQTAVRKTQPDRIFHLGDYTRDAAALARLFPQIPLDNVSGNCDTFDRKNIAPAERLLLIEGHRILLCHGHSHQVKSGLDVLIAYARKQAVRVCLFGHTHTALCREPEPGLLLVNPGSIGAALRREYAVLEITPEQLHCTRRTL
ncbi:MAG: metallophosphoesterase family protein [Faecousia sp.]